MSWARREVPFFLELLALTGLAVTQPVFDVFQRGANIFVLRDAGAVDVVAFALVVGFAPAVAIWAVEAAVGLRSPRIRTWLHLAFVTVVAGGLAVVVLKKVTTWPPGWLVAASAGIALVLGVLRSRFAATRLWLLYLSAGSMLFVIVFLFASPVTSIAFAEGTGHLDPVDVARPAPVIVVVFDELPTVSLLDGSGGIDDSLFPHFAALAGDATWYRNASTVGPDTPVAVPAILTGSYPSDQRDLPVARNYPDNLFTLLAGAYDLNVFELATDLCPSDICPETEGAPRGGALPSLLGDALDVWSELVSPARAGAPGFEVQQSEPRAGTRFGRFVDSLSSDPGPRLDFLHIISPHQPWRTLPAGTRYDSPGTPEGLGRGYVWETDFAAASARSRHLLQLQFADRLLGQLLDRLHELGTYDETMIVVTADHGVAFTDGSPVRGASSHNFAEIMWVPLFVKAPGSSTGDGSVDDRPMQSIDILPTIAATLGIDIPFAVDGFAAGARPPGPDTRRLLDWGLSTLEPDDGGYRRFPGADGFADVLGWGPAGDVNDDPGLRLFRIGEYGDLLGTRANSLVDTTAASSLQGTLDHADALAEVDLHAETLPLYISGTVDVDHPVDLAVAVNGVIAGWCRTVGASLGGGQAFWVVVPPALLGDGANEVGIYELHGSPSDPRLAQLRLGG